MEEIDIATIKKKSLSGIVALTSQTFLLQVVAFGATVLLTIFLTPSIFGIFYVVSAIIAFLSYFSDIGLAAALIQKKEALTHEDLVTTFTIQQTLVLSMSILAFFLAPTIGHFYKLDASGIMLLRALVISFFCSSLKTIPSVLLERKLEFKKLIIPEIVETFVFYFIAVVLAWRGMGIVSFTWAVLVRGIVGLIVMYSISPWPVSFGISRDVAKRLLKFGVPFQMNSFLALLKDDLMTVFLGKVLPFAQVGYIGWAKKWAEVPLRLIMDSVIRVTFPTFSRLQHSKELLGKAIEQTIFGLSLAIFPISVGLLFFVEPAVKLIPKYGKWEPALFSFALFILSSALAGFSTPLTNALNAVGRIKITMILMIFWTIATWILTVIFIHFFGFNGFAIALCILSFSLVIVIQLTRKIAKFSFIEYMKWPLIGALLQAALYIIARGNAPYNIPRLILVAVSGVILYTAIVWVTQRKRIVDILRAFHI